ncbi:hypothetical protein KSP39_PZI001660 [Platanthera zijinensis]|uniref:Uncharacterized protein n=1 Tax=Platanthera zijinensis TaxID=2320716 RepID=A0AAP0GDV4_9ASPA
MRKYFIVKRARVVVVPGWVTFWKVPVGALNSIFPHQREAAASNNLPQGLRQTKGTVRQRSSGVTR